MHTTLGADQEHLVPDRPLDAVSAAIRDAGPDGRSASEVAEVVGASRVTVRRYLEHLADSGAVVRRPRYGGGGRPEVEYRWGS